MRGKLGWIVGLTVVCAGVWVPLTQAQFVIQDSNGLFTPSYRGAGNTTWFGWTPGSYDAEPGLPADNDELIQSPPTTVGGAVGANLVQNNATDMLSGSNSMFYPPAGPPPPG